MFKGKKAFIAGGRTGFIGTNMAKALLERGATVYLHSLNSDKPSFFAPNTPNIFESTGDLSVSATLPSDIDYVFHCAAHTSGAHEMATNPVAQITTNAFMNSLLLDTAAKTKVKKFFFISSSAIYPELDIPISEDKGFEGDPPGNYFGPGWMKRYTEKLAEFYFNWYGMEVLVIRPSNVYGPYSGFDLERAHVLPALIRKFVEKHNPIEVWGVPEVVRDFIYVEDFVKGALLAFEKSSGFDVFNIATGQLFTIGEAVDTIKELTDYTGTITYNSSKPMTIRQRKIDVTKAAKVLNFQTNISFREGLGRTIDWYKSTL
ncbi:MAG: NAD-dependent epimerase/dehydratase family protein [Deltaproteobacteria bacterium]|nr:NAD-dependent epimerase/dehydratase family protein [Deltaproteobacteria bacterium]